MSHHQVSKVRFPNAGDLAQTVQLILREAHPLLPEKLNPCFQLGPAQRSALGQSIPKGRMCHVAVIAQNMALAGWHSAGKFNARNKGHAFWQMLCQLFCPYYRVVVGEGEYLDARGFHVPRKLNRCVCPVGSGGVHMQINHTGHPPCLQYDPRYNNGWLATALPSPRHSIMFPLFSRLQTEYSTNRSGVQLFLLEAGPSVRRGKVLVYAEQRT